MIKCMKTFLVGTFLFFTGLAELVLVLTNEPYNLGGSHDRLLRTLVGTILILWIGGGLWVTLYGKLVPCDIEPPTSEDE